MNYFGSNYVILSSYVNLLKGKKEFIGSKDNRTCRYCGKTAADVPFKLEAHALPEFTGNKSLIAYDECDICNEKFSRLVEDHFGKYLGALRTLSQVHGKKGVPTYKGQDGKSRISMGGAGLQVTDYEDDPIWEINEESKTVTVTAHRQPYVPAAVFKCLVKMAISITPSSLLGEMGHLCKWILEDNHTYESFPYNPLVVFEQFTPGPMPYPGVTVFLLRRKQKVTDVPYMQFIAAFGNTMYQIIVPMPEQDKALMGKPTQLSLFPVPFSEGYEYGKTAVHQLDLSRYEIVKNEPHVMHMTYQVAVKHETLNK